MKTGCYNDQPVMIATYSDYINVIATYSVAVTRTCGQLQLCHLMIF